VSCGGSIFQCRSAVAGLQREQAADAREACDVLDDVAVAVVRRNVQARETVLRGLEQQRLTTFPGQVLDHRKMPTARSVVQAREAVCCCLEHEQRVAARLDQMLDNGQVSVLSCKMQARDPAVDFCFEEEILSA
jgi:alkanesulfonate monooxygenase SsuD/methylene tetrahydromethanopterin reductase-like flavin-dependent oxidoreductase (luciferase family)